MAEAFIGFPYRSKLGRCTTLHGCHKPKDALDLHAGNAASLHYAKWANTGSGTLPVSLPHGVLHLSQSPPIFRICRPPSWSTPSETLASLDPDSADITHLGGTQAVISTMMPLTTIAWEARHPDDDLLLRMATLHASKLGDDIMGEGIQPICGSSTTAGIHRLGSGTGINSSRRCSRSGRKVHPASLSPTPSSPHFCLAERRATSATTAPRGSDER